MRIGITMRVANAQGYDEPRDCLAQDWIKYMESVFPNVPWMPIPNIGTGVLDFLKQWDVSGIIFSGGNDLGTCESRDVTERLILEYALKNDMPIFGVCRGLQLFQYYYNGELSEVDSDKHVAHRHPIRLSEDGDNWIDLDVNSFHNYGISPEKLAENLKPFAFSDDGSVEGIHIKNHRGMAVMWHPERETNIHDIDCKLMRQHFGLETI